MVQVWVFRAFLVGYLLVTGTSVTVSAATLTTNDTLRIEFTTNPQHFGSFTPDVLGVFWYSPTTFSGVTGVAASLYDGSTLLGTHTFAGCCPTFSFKSSTSPYTFGNPIVIDFTPLLDGSIDGALEVNLLGGTLSNFDLVTANFSGPELIFAAASSASGASWNGNWISVSSMAIVPASPVPEPGTLMLVGGALVGAGVRRWRRQRGCQGAQAEEESLVTGH